MLKINQTEPETYYYPINKNFRNNQRNLTTASFEEKHAWLRFRLAENTGAYKTKTEDWRPKTEKRVPKNEDRRPKNEVSSFSGLSNHRQVNRGKAFPNTTTAAKSKGSSFCR